MKLYEVIYTDAPAGGWGKKMGVVGYCYAENKKDALGKVGKNGHDANVVDKEELIEKYESKIGYYKELITKVKEAK